LNVVRSGGSVTPQGEHLVDGSYVEAVLVWREGARSERVEQWLSRENLRWQEMRLGLLVTGDRATFEAAFDIDLGTAQPPVRITVPAELRDDVESITIPPPRQIMSPSR
jgi:hypothetical protein